MRVTAPASRASLENFNSSARLGRGCDRAGSSSVGQCPSFALSLRVLRRVVTCLSVGIGLLTRPLRGKAMRLSICDTPVQRRDVKLKARSHHHLRRSPSLLHSTTAENKPDGLNTRSYLVVLLDDPFFMPRGDRRLADNLLRARRRLVFVIVLSVDTMRRYARSRRHMRLERATAPTTSMSSPSPRQLRHRQRRRQHRTTRHPAKDATIL
jgi:hypothetical protein